jgi:hypothetical protein
MGNAQSASEPYPDPNVVTIKGMANSVTSVGIFVQNLNQLPYFKNVVIKAIGVQTLAAQGNSPQVEANTFEITAFLR